MNALAKACISMVITPEQEEYIFVNFKELSNISNIGNKRTVQLTAINLMKVLLKPCY